MGRGRQKAKQTKVARELKYYSPDTDLTSLQRELGSGSAGPLYREPAPADEQDDAQYDAYEDWTRRSG